MQPLPVPTSSSRRAVGCSLVTHSTSSSVSGRGMSTPSRTLKLMPQNSASPSSYCTGRPAASRAMTSSSPSSSSSAPGSASSCVRLTPPSPAAVSSAMLRASSCP